MINRENEIIIFDFDVVSIYSSLLDLVTCFESCDFNHLDINKIEEKE